MAATISNGYVFGSSETVTSAKLDTQFSSATISNISNTEMDSVSRVMTNAASLPTASLIGGQPVYLSTIDHMFMRLASETEWGVFPHERRLTNQRGSACSLGDVVVPDTANALAVKANTTANAPGAVLVTVDSSVANGSVGGFKSLGFVPQINLTNSAAIGDVLATSTTSGRATATTGFPAAGNCFGVALGTGSTPKALLWGAAASDFGSVTSNITKEVDPRQTVRIWEDFFAFTPVGTVSSSQLTVQAAQTWRAQGTATTVAGLVTAPAGSHGILRLLATGQLELGTNGATAFPIPLNGTSTASLLKARLAGVGTAGGVNYFGMHDVSVNGFTADSGLYISAAAATGNYQLENRNAGVGSATVASAIAHSNGLFRTFEIRRTGTNVAQFFIDNTVRGTMTQAFGTALMTLGAQAGTGGANDGLDLDYLYSSYDR